MRLIDADALIEKLKTYQPQTSKQKLASLLAAEAPTIDLVRCKECKYWKAYETWSECERWTDDPYETAKTNADDFCSYGERREP